MPEPQLRRYRAVLRLPENPGEPVKPEQTLHPTRESAIKWAKQILVGKEVAQVEIYVTTETLVEIVGPTK